MHSSRNFNPSLFVSSVLICICGCYQAGELLIPVEGQVTLAGKPLEDGSISFRPDASKGNMSLHHPTGAINSQGSYRLFVGRRAGVPPGHYKVVIFASEPTNYESGSVHPGMPKSLINRRYNAPQTTPLTVEVAPDVEGVSLDFDLEPAV